MKFPSKKDWWLAVIIWGAMLVLIGIGCYGLIVIHGANIGILLLILILSILFPIFILWMLVTTYYILDDDNLVVRCGPFRSLIPLHTIRSAQKTRNPLASFALSLERIEIVYGSFHEFVLISPKNQEVFLDILQTKCPQAIIKK